MPEPAKSQSAEAAKPVKPAAKPVEAIEPVAAEPQESLAPAPAEPPQKVSLSKRAEMAHEDFLRQLIADRNRPPPPPKPKEPLTDRKKARLALEQKAGKKRVEAAQAARANRPVRKADPVREGYNTPVFRGGEYVKESKVGGK